MVEEQEELVRRAREEHWAVWGVGEWPGDSGGDTP